MARIEEIRQFMQQLAPAELAADWDNVGVLVDCSVDITSILVSLDITEEVVVEAEMQGCQLIVSHHPVIFKPLSRIGRRDVPFRMIKKNISALCAHTNLDAAQGGVNDILCKLFEISGAEPFGEEGIGRIGRVAPTDVRHLADRCKDTLDAGGVKLVDTGKPITRLAVVGGSGGSMVKEAAAAGVKLLVAEAVNASRNAHFTAVQAERLDVQPFSVDKQLSFRGGHDDFLLVKAFDILHAGENQIAPTFQRQPVRGRGG